MNLKGENLAIALNYKNRNYYPWEFDLTVCESDSQDIKSMKEMLSKSSSYNCDDYNQLAKLFYNELHDLADDEGQRAGDQEEDEEFKVNLNEEIGDSERLKKLKRFARDGNQNAFRVVEDWQKMKANKPKSSKDHIERSADRNESFADILHKKALKQFSEPTPHIDYLTRRAANGCPVAEEALNRLHKTKSNGKEWATTQAQKGSIMAMEQLKAIENFERKEYLVHDSNLSSSQNDENCTYENPKKIERVESNQPKISFSSIAKDFFKSII